MKRDSLTTKPVEPSTTGRGRQQRKSMKQVVTIARQKSPIKQAKKQQHPPLASTVVPNSLSPGQQVQAQHISYLVSQPTHPLTQQILTAHYGLPLPLASVARGGEGARKESNWLTQGQIITGPTTTHLTTLPRANRRDAQVARLPYCLKFQEGIISQFVEFCSKTKFSDSHSVINLKFRGHSLTHKSAKIFKLKNFKLSTWHSIGITI